MPLGSRPKPSGNPPRASRWALRGAGILLIGLALTTVPTLGPVLAQLPSAVELLDILRFDPMDIAADPGQNISLRIVNVGSAPHTFTVFAQPNADVPVDPFPDLLAYYEQNENLADVSLPGGGEGWANFTAPSTNATYVIVCMELGHAVGGMVGALVVGEPEPGGGLIWPLGLIQTLFVIALVGTAAFAVIYQLRSSRR